MSTFQKTAFTVVLATAFVGVSAISHGREVCDKDGKNCFVYECLKPIENKTTKMVEMDPPLCKASSRVQYQGENRTEMLKQFTDGCIGAGGTLEHKGSKVTCSLRRPKPQQPLKQ